MKGIVTNLGFAAGTVTAEDGRTFVIYGGSFAGGQQKTLAVGDVVTFEPGGKGEAFATHLKLTPYCKWQDKLFYRERVPLNKWGQYIWHEALRRRGCIVPREEAEQWSTA